MVISHRSILEAVLKLIKELSFRYEQQCAWSYLLPPQFSSKTSLTEPELTAWNKALCIKQASVHTVKVKKKLCGYILS